MRTISLVKPLFLASLLGLGLLALSCTRQAGPAARDIAPPAPPPQSFVTTLVERPAANSAERLGPDDHAPEEASAQAVEAPQPDSVQVAQAEGAARPAMVLKSQGTPVIPGWTIDIPSVNVRSEVVSVGLEDDGAMQAPSGPDEVGWYQFGPTPGQQGNVLLAGHVDWTDRQTGRARGAVFWSLSRAAVGSEVVVSDGTNDYVYYVAEKYRFAWDDPTGVAVLQPTEDYRLTLITCGGNFDRSTRSYDMRDVVIAYLVG